MTPELKCEVCNKIALGVCSSPLSAISHAFCRECLELNRQPYSTLVGGLYGCIGKEKGEFHYAEWVEPIIEATLKFYSKTKEDLWNDVNQLENDYENHMRHRLDNEETKEGREETNSKRD